MIPETVMPAEEVRQKYQSLKEYLQSFQTVAVAFSGGVDSTLLLYAAREALGEHAVAVTVESGFFPKREAEAAASLCKELGVRQCVISVDEQTQREIIANPPDRCYLCKRYMFQEMKKETEAQNILVLAEGSNVDDEGDYRPGMRAVEELGIVSPLRDCRLRKDEIRSLSRWFHLPTWDKPAYACLASRFPYRKEISKADLAMVEQAEGYLMELGFPRIRVRILENTARIEAPVEELPRFLEPRLREKIVKKLKELGFCYVSLDLQGYRTGSMNEVL